jgi:hypothetical protein
MATRVYRKDIITFLCRFLRDTGGAAKTANILHAIEGRFTLKAASRCIATRVSDARKLGAVIHYDDATDQYRLEKMPDLEHPRQRSITSLEDAIAHADEWYARGRKGAIDTEAVRTLANFARQQIGYTTPPPPKYKPPPRAARAAPKSYRLFD